MRVVKKRSIFLLALMPLAAEGFTPQKRQWGERGPKQPPRTYALQAIPPLTETTALASSTYYYTDIYEAIPLPLLYSLFAGLSTCLGAAIVFVCPPNSSTMSLSLSLAGSVMVTVSVDSLLPEAFDDLLSLQSAALCERILSFLLGCGLYGLLSSLFALRETDEILGFTGDSSANSLHATTEWKSADDDAESLRSWRVAMILFVSLLIHNLPEGCAVGASTAVSPQIGLTTALAIAMHNIPEGVAIAVPALQAHPEKPWMAFGLASLSGLAEPAGAAITLFLMERSTTTSLVDNMQNMLAFVAGIMLTVAIRELFPEALRHAEKGKSPLVFGALSGVGIMLATERYLQVS